MKTNFQSQINEIKKNISSVLCPEMLFAMNKKYNELTNKLNEKK